jgi:hypothetical protein
MIKKKRNKYISFIILFVMLLANIVVMGTGLQVKAQVINNLLVSKVVNKGNVTINVTNSTTASDWVTITLYNRANDNLVFLDQIKLVVGQGSSNTMLDPGTYYGYAKSASDASVVPITDFTIVPEQPVVVPPVPTGLVATSLGISVINLSWTTVTGATGYNIYRATTAGGTYTKINTGLVTTNSYTDTGLSAATAYYYKVATINVAGESSKSTSVTATTGTGGGGTPSEDSGSTGGNDNTNNNGSVNSLPVQVVIDNSGSAPKAVITVDSTSIVKDKINEVKPTISDTTKALELKVNADNIKDGAGSLLVTANNITMSIPFSVVDYTNVQAGTYVRLEQASNSTDESLSGTKTIGEALNFNLGLYNNQGTKLSDIHQFAQGKVRINIKLTDAQIKNLNTSKLVALYYNEATKKWELVGGSYDTPTKIFSFETEHFSKYTIADVSEAPVFDAIANHNGEQGTFMQIKVNAVSSNNMSLTYSATSLPTGATFDAATQNLNWTPNVDQAGSYIIGFNVTDGVTTVKKDVAVIVRDVPATELLEKALEEKDFYHFNIAYYKINKLSDEKEKAESLDKLATIHELVWNASIANINKILDELVVTGSGKIYDDVQVVINSTNLSAVDKGYLLGEVTSWGKKLVFTEEYKVAVDAINVAWDKLDMDSVTKAEAAVAKVTNTHSKEYLLGEITKIKVKIK